MRHSRRSKDQDPPSPEDRWIPNDSRRHLLALEDDEVPGTCAHVTKECDMCGSSHVCLVALNCGHSWCKSCARENIRVGLGDAESWPPKCCEPFSEQVIGWARDQHWVQLWRQMGEEQGTPGGQRVYCSRPDCAEFIPNRPGRWLMANGERIEEADQCLACGDKTCRKCRHPAHPGKKCHLDQEDEELMDLMDRERMAACPECNRVIQLKEGCNHITCHCGHEWCFLCGRDWRRTGCKNRCQAYNGEFIPARARKKRFRQGRSEEDHKPIRKMQAPEEVDLGAFAHQLPQRLPRWRMPADMEPMAPLEDRINLLMMRQRRDLGREPRARADQAQAQQPEDRRPLRLQALDVIQHLHDAAIDGDMDMVNRTIRTLLPQRIDEGHGALWMRPREPAGP